MKKILVLALAAVMVMALCGSAMAAGTLTIESRADANATVNTTSYTIYQMMLADIRSVSTPNENTGVNAGTGTVAYYVTDSALASALNGLSMFTATASSSGTRWEITVDGTPTAEQIAAALYTIKDKATYTRTINATSSDPDADIVFSGLADGYYLVESSNSLSDHTKLVAQTVGDGHDVTIKEKNDYPTLTKSTDEYEVEIGQAVTYTLSITIPSNPAQKDLVVFDRMENTLTLSPATITVTGTKTGEEITGLSFGEDTITDASSKVEGFNYYTATIPAAKVVANAGETLVLTYTAHVNQNAVVYDEVDNYAHLEYGDHSYATPEVKEEVKTLAVNVIKVDSADNTIELTGAEFTLYKAASGGDAIKLVEISGGYQIASPAQIADDTVTKVTTIVAGNVVIKGLDENTYYLQEDKAPAGYRQKTDGRFEVIAGTNATLTYNLENPQGLELPSTGGIGTTIFYVSGLIMVLGAATILISRRRAESK